MDVLGLTFGELCERLSPRRHEIRGLRSVYRRLCLGEAESLLYGGVLLTAQTWPVVRSVREEELTKFVQRDPSGLEIESVMVPMSRRGRCWTTLCVSSQIGCARGCRFCATARMGHLRDLTAAEMVGQVTAARRQFGVQVRNVVFMGMGEPFDNFDGLMQAVRVLTDRSGLSMAAERISISTVGRTEGIRRLADLGWRRINLAVSLNAPNDDIRSRIMPVNRLEPMARLREALLAYPLRRCQFFMIEYVLIPGVNDAPGHAAELAGYLRPLKSVVNVIPYNPVPGADWPAPTEEQITAFIAALKACGLVVKRRLTKGRGQMAACGQLGNAALRALGA